MNTVPLPMRTDSSQGFGPNTASRTRKRIYEIIFESDTPAGKLFDIFLIIAIIVSVAVVMLDSVHSIREDWLVLLRTAEWFFTLLFTVEYGVRIYSVNRPSKYIFSFFGVVDLLAIVPTYFSVLLPTTAYLVVIRVLRILRVFRILKLGAYLGEADILMQSLSASRKKVEVFLFTVMMLVIIFGSLMYLVEGEENGFTSIPRSIYWAIVTLTTVGYGDIAPKTNFGQVLASLIMICGYSIIAVPTGIVSAEMFYASGKKRYTRVCGECGSRFHEEDSLYCRHCGNQL
jgi:voltage-gated potassium channel